MEYGFEELKEWLKNEGTLNKVAKERMEKSGREKGKGEGKKHETIINEGEEGEEENEKGKEKEVDSGKGKFKASTRSYKCK